MILLRWLTRTWTALAAPPADRRPGPRALPSYARMGRYIVGEAALDPRIDLLVRQLAADLSGCRWCIAHGLHRWRQAFLPITELDVTQVDLAAEMELRQLRVYASQCGQGREERSSWRYTESAWFSFQLCEQLAQVTTRAFMAVPDEEKLPRPSGRCLPSAESVPDTPHMSSPGMGRTTTPSWGAVPHGRRLGLETVSTRCLETPC